LSELDPRRNQFAVWKVRWQGNLIPQTLRPCNLAHLDFCAIKILKEFACEKLFCPQHIARTRVDHNRVRDRPYTDSASVTDRVAHRHPNYSTDADATPFADGDSITFAGGVEERRVCHRRSGER
jgi:hypothetical protein